MVNDSTVRAGRVVAVRTPRHPLPGAQSVEYLRAFLFGRLGWNRLGGNLVISGAFGLFDRASLLTAGGYLHNTVGEDMELVARLRRTAIEAGLPGRVAFVPDPVAWTEVPATLRVLGRQRDRWHRGLTDVLWRHRKLLLNPRYGTLGLVVVPYFWAVELIAPIVEALGVVALVIGIPLGLIDVSFALAFFFVAYGLGLLLSTASILLEECAYHRSASMADRVRLLGWAVFEATGYRQLTVIWRLRGIIRYFRRNTDWGHMVRRGFVLETSAGDHDDGASRRSIR